MGEPAALVIATPVRPVPPVIASGNEVGATLAAVAFGWPWPWLGWAATPSVICFLACAPLRFIAPASATPARGGWVCLGTWEFAVGAGDLGLVLLGRRAWLRGFPDLHTPIAAVAMLFPKAVSALPALSPALGPAGPVAIVLAIRPFPGYPAVALTNIALVPGHPAPAVAPLVRSVATLTAVATTTRLATIAAVATAIRLATLATIVRLARAAPAAATIVCSVATIAAGTQRPQ